MTTICTNIAVIHCSNEQVLQDILTDLTRQFDCYTQIETDDTHCELEFAYNDSFPKKEMETLTDKYGTKDDTIYIQVITYELPKELVEHHIYQHGKWMDKIAEKQVQNNKNKSNN